LQFPESHCDEAAALGAAVAGARSSDLNVEILHFVETFILAEQCR